MQLQPVSHECATEVLEVALDTDAALSDEAGVIVASAACARGEFAEHATTLAANRIAFIHC